jgi:hypothetical protein
LPAWPWNESGGFFAESRCARTAFAFVPAPPATVSFLNGQLLFVLFQIVISLASPAASPPPVHHEKTDSWHDAAELLGADVFAVTAAGIASASAATSAPAASRLRESFIQPS